MKAQAKYNKNLRNMKAQAKYYHMIKKRLKYDAVSSCLSSTCEGQTQRISKWSSITEQINMMKKSEDVKEMVEK